MKNLKSLEVFGNKVKVEIVELPNNIGGLYHCEGKIQINSLVADKDKMQVLIHEFFHAVFHRVSIDQTVGYEVEQIIVDTFSKALCENFDIRIKKR